MGQNFQADPDIAAIAEAYALDAVDVAREKFRVTLDWTDPSIAELEAILDQMQRSIKQARPSAERVHQFAKIHGSYLGEVFRRNHGAAWGMVNLGGQTFPGLRATGRGQLFWPWGRVQNRLTNGAEDNVWHYYQTLVGARRDEGR